MFSELSTASQYDLINYLHYGGTEMNYEVHTQFLTKTVLSTQRSMLAIRNNILSFVY